MWGSYCGQEEFEKTQAISKTSKELRLAIGTKLIRDYQGKTITVTVIHEGFEFKNKMRYNGLNIKNYEYSIDLAIFVCVAD